MSDKISAFLEIILNIIRSIAGSPALIVSVIGILTMLLGSILNVGGIIVLGIFLLGTGVLIYFVELLKR
jgi:hypothetical protein